MRAVLRVVLLLISLGILAVAFFPPRNPDPSTEVEVLVESIVDLTPPSPSPTPEPETTPSPRESGIVRDMLGGAQIDAGNKAKEVIGEVNEIRQNQIDALDADQR